MGHVFTQIRVIHPTDASRFAETSALVDTGSSFTIINQKMAVELGLAPYRELSFVLASGQRVKWVIAHCRLEVEGQTIYQDVAIRPGDKPIIEANGRRIVALIGVQTLESLGLYVNTNTGKLVQGPALALICIDKRRIQACKVMIHSSSLRGVTMNRDDEAISEVWGLNEIASLHSQ